MSKILFITTKNIDYIRNTQEINLLKERYDEVQVLGYKDHGYAKRLVKLYFRLLTMSLKGYDEIFIGFAPQLILPFWNWKFRGKKITIDFFISVWDTLVCDRKKFKPSSLLAKIVWKLDYKCIHSAQHVVCDTNAHGDFFANEFKVDRKSIETIYLEADEQIYYPRKQEKPEKLRDKYVVLYFGSILPLQGVEILMDALRLLKDQADIRFIVIGPMKSNIEKCESDNIQYINWLSQEELAQYISWADLCLAGHFHGTIEKAKRTIPGKAYIYEKMEKDMILGDGPANHELFKEDEHHHFVEMGNAKALSELILKCKNARK